MKKFIKIEIESTSSADNEMLIAELSENNFYAFEENENNLAAYILEKDFDEVLLKNLLPANAVYKYFVIEDRNWNEEWEQGFEPIYIKNFAGIRSSFHKSLTGVKYEIIITPKMSFGTGHHATTFLMIELMEGIDFLNKNVVDFGTGTGVLAILAEKLRAASITAIDNDEWSFANATENIQINNCHKILLKLQNNINSVSNVDIIVANINFNVLEQNAEIFSSLLKAKSLLLISGILTSDKKNLVAIFEKHNFLQKKMSRKEGWLAILFEKQFNL